MSLLRIDSSIRVDGSVSRAVADTFESAWRTAHPGGVVATRDLAADPVPSDVWAKAVAASRTPVETHTPDVTAAAAFAKALADEVFAADTIVLSTALYNFGVSQHVKAWIDVLITDPRLSSSTVTPLAGRTAVLIVARGGGYGAGTPREGWDHATGWLRRILNDVWGLNLEVIEAELTLAPIVPAMAGLVEASEQLLRSAHDTAAELGQTHGELARSAA